MDPIEPRYNKLLALARAKNAAAGKPAVRAEKNTASRAADVSTPDTMSATASPPLKPSLSPKYALSAPRSPTELSPPTTPGESSEDEATAFKPSRRAFFTSADIEYVGGFPTFRD